MAQKARKDPAPKIKMKAGPSSVKGKTCIVCGKTSGDKKINEHGEVRHPNILECAPCAFTGRPCDKLVIGPDDKVLGIHSSVPGYDSMPTFGFNEKYPEKN